IAAASLAAAASGLTKDVPAARPGEPTPVSEPTFDEPPVPDEQPADTEETATRRDTGQRRTPTTRRGTGRSGRAPVGVLVAGAAAVVAGAAAIGFLVAPTSTKAVTSNVPLSQRATAGPLTISYPAGWAQTGSTPAAASSFKLTNAVTLTADKSAPGAAL